MENQVELLCIYTRDGSRVTFQFFQDQDQEFVFKFLKIKSAKTAQEFQDQDPDPSLISTSVPLSLSNHFIIKYPYIL